LPLVTKRACVDMGKLDALVQQELAVLSPVTGFSLTLWRDLAQSDGCNWNARLEPLPKCTAVDTRWWDVIPKLRSRYNLDPIEVAEAA
jgi:hypothetical protein